LNKIFEEIKTNIYKYLVIGAIAMAGSYLVSFGGYGLGLWFGSYVMVDLKNVKYNAGNILIIIWLVLTVGQYISQLGPCLKKIS
jgi:hypothetical protein